MNDYSDLPALPVYTLATELAAETSKPLGVWLHLIAKAAFSEAHKPGSGLKLRPDDEWGFWGLKHNKKFFALGPPFNRWPPSTDVVRRFEPGEDPYERPWDIWFSLLLEFSKTIYHPIGEETAARIKRQLDDEGVVIYRDDFRQWCLAAGYTLPRFWFDAESTAAAKEALTPEQVLTQAKGKTEKEKNLLLKTEFPAMTHADRDALLSPNGRSQEHAAIVKRSQRRED